MVNMGNQEAHLQAITDMLEMIDKVTNDNRCFASLLLSKGALWTAAEKPEEFERLQSRQCFGNAQSQVLKDYRKGRALFTYVEGYACSGSLGFPFPTHHGWLVDKNGTVIDQTWENPKESTYFGIPINTSYLVEKEKKFDVYASVFDNYLDKWALLKDEDLLNFAIMKWNSN